MNVGLYWSYNFHIHLGADPWICNIEVATLRRPWNWGATPWKPEIPVINKWISENGGEGAHRLHPFNPPMCIGYVQIVWPCYGLVMSIRLYAYSGQFLRGLDASILMYALIVSNLVWKQFNWLQLVRGLFCLYDVRLVVNLYSSKPFMLSPIHSYLILNCMCILLR